MWHRITLTGSELDAALEMMKLLTTMSTGLLQRSSVVAGMVAALQMASLPARLKQEPVEIYSRKEYEGKTVKTVLYLNDAALATYQEFGGRRPVEQSMPKRPPDPHSDDILLGETTLLKHVRFEVEE